MTINVADKETLDAILNSLKIAKEGTDITLAKVERQIELSYNQYKWSASPEILVVQVPLEGYYTISATFSAEHGTNSEYTYGGYIYAGTDSSADTSTTYKTISSGTVPLKGTLDTVGCSMYMKRGEKMVLRGQGWSTGPAKIKKVTVSYSI